VLRPEADPHQKEHHRNLDEYTDDGGERRPDERPKSMVAVAMATSKWFEAPIIEAGAAYS
jgi:hypothetical protein